MGLLVEAHDRRTLVAVAAEPGLGPAQMQLLLNLASSEPSISDDVVAFTYPAKLLSNRWLVRNRRLLVGLHL